MREPVAEYYTRLSDETIYWFLRVHQDNIWPHVRQQIAHASTLPHGSIFEGSALRPEFLATLDDTDVVPLGLHADDEFLRARIVASSNYMHEGDATKLLIDKFLTPALRQNADFLTIATDLGLPVLNAADETELAVYVENLIGDLRSRTRS